MVQVEDINWPAEYKELTTIDDLLHCKICYEYVDTSVVTPCSHNYCSICIRKFLHYKTQCPACYSNIYEKDLHPNRIIDEILSSYLTLRVKLAACIKGVDVKRSFIKMVESPIRNPPTPSKKFKEEYEADVNDVSTPKTTRTESRIHKTTPNDKILATPSTSDINKITPKINSIFESKSVEKSKADTEGKRVPCPVCGIHILNTNINRHLDDCLKRQRSMSPPKQVNNGLDPIPKYVTNLMKDAELRKLLKKYGLNTTGVRKTLEKRLQRFSVIYNAERDKISPKNLSDIVKQCEDEEIAEKNLPKSNKSNYVQAVDRNTDISVIDKIRKQYLKNNKNDYQKLIESINVREKKENNVQRSLFNKNDEDSIASTSSASRITNQSIFDRSEDTNSSGMDLGQYLPPDSDSSTQCPLQYYSNEDPMRFLSVEISSDDSDDSPMKFDKNVERKREENRRIVDVDGEEETTNLLEEIAGVDPSSPRSIEKGEQIFTPESKSDIFDASTEDNWSDEEDLKKCNNGVVLNSTFNNNDNNNRAKKFNRKTRFKLSKRTKRRSSDSETDVEEIGPKNNTTRLFGNLKTTGGRDSVENSAGLKDNESKELNSSQGIIDEEKSLKIEKENLQDIISTIETDGASCENTARRSSTRKRNCVQYSNYSRKYVRKTKKDKILEERSMNFVEINDNDVKAENDLGNNKPLKKRRKTVKQ